MKKIVVGYTPGQPGEAALRSGVAEARVLEASLLIVFSQSTAYSDQGFDPDRRRRHLDKLLTGLVGEAVMSYRIEIGQGIDPAEDILGAAAENGADLIVIGLRRRSAVGKLIMGSTAQRVLLEARCPVLTVKPENDRG